ncbi:MAG: lipoprotein [Burkholderiales bacterium]|nr:lipoprotein [Burkholderiales bacterium]
MITFALSLTLTACGQKGPLYLPEKPSAAPTTPATGSSKASSATSATPDTSKDKTQR